MSRSSRFVGLVALGAALVAVVVFVRSRSASDESTPDGAREDVELVRAETSELERSLLGEQLHSEPAADDVAAERQTVAASTAGAAGASDELIVEVRGPDGAPAENLTVALARGENVVAHAETSAEGIASFPALAPELDLYVLCGAILCRRERLEVARGHHAIRLDDSVVLRGTVLVDGGPPPAPIRFGLHTAFDAKTLSTAPEFVCRAVLGVGAPQDHSIMGRSIPFVTDTGRIAIYGLSPSWRGDLVFGGPYSLEGGGQRLEVTDARVPVVVRLKTKAAVVGRVVNADTREPARRASGTYALECKERNARGGLQCDVDGRFRVLLGCREPARVRISLGAKGGRRLLDLRDVPADGLDLGDVELEPAPDVHVVVRDELGRPIVDAVVRALDGSEAFGDTDLNGRTTLAAVLPTAREVEVEAFGFQSKRCAVDPARATEERPLEIVMQAAPLLDVRVRVREGESPRGLVVHVLSWDAEPFEIARGRSADFTSTVEGAGGWSGVASERSEGAAWTMRASLAGAGHLRVTSFAPRERTVVRLLDGAGVALEEREVTAAMLASRTPIVFVLDAEPRTLALEIVDPEGEPLANARVVGADPSDSAAESNLDGKAFVENVYSDRVDVTVSRHGFVPSHLEGVAMDASVVHRRVVMERGMSVSVCVIDARGLPVTASTVEARANGALVARGRRTASEPCARLQDLPQTDVEIGALVGGRWFRQAHDSRVSNARIQVPDHGSLRVELALPLQPMLYRVRVRDERDAAVVIPADVFGDPPPKHVDVPIVFPGDYTVELVLLALTAEAQETVLARAEHVTVRASGWTDVRLAKP